MNLICNDIVKHIYEMSKWSSFTINQFTKMGVKTNSPAFEGIMELIFSTLKDAKYIALYTEKDGNTSGSLAYHFTDKGKKVLNNFYQCFSELH